MPRARSVRLAKSIPALRCPALEEAREALPAVRTMRNRSAPLLAQMVIGTIIIKPLRLGPPTRSTRLQPEAGEAVAGDLAGQFGLPAQIGAHRLLIAGVAVVVPENGVDTLIVRRLIGRA